VLTNLTPGCLRCAHGNGEEKHHREQVRLQRDPQTHQRYGQQHRPQQVGAMTFSQMTVGHIAKCFGSAS
jgi:hypothetical protein